MNPTLKYQLKKWKQLHQESAPKKVEKKTPHQKPIKEKFEELSESDIKSLVGMNQRGLKRGKGGAWR